MRDSSIPSAPHAREREGEYRDVVIQHAACTVTISDNERALCIAYDRYVHSSSVWHQLVCNSIGMNAAKAKHFVPLLVTLAFEIITRPSFCSAKFFFDTVKWVSQTTGLITGVMQVRNPVCTGAAAVDETLSGVL